MARPVAEEPKRMQRYVMAMKWSKDNEFTISDHAETPQFTVRKIYGLDGNSLSLLDTDGKQLAAVKPRTKPTGYDVTTKSGPAVPVYHKGWFGRTFIIESPGSEMTASTGVFISGSYHLTALSAPRASVYRQSRTLTIDMADGEDPVALLSIVLAIEAIREDRYEAQGSIPYARLVLALVN